MAAKIPKIVTIRRPHDAELSEEQLLEEAREVPELDPPRSGEWPVLVLKADHVDRVWLRVLAPHYDEVFRQLMSRLEDYYGQRGEGRLVGCPRPGLVCVAPLQGFWCRVMLVAIHPDDTTTVASIDEITSARLPVSHLRQIEPCFAELPSQAFRCCLEGLSELSSGGDCGGPWLLGRLVSLRLQASFNANGGLPHGPPLARLWDCRGRDLNQSVVDRATLRTFRPQLPQDGEVCVVAVTAVSESGDVWVRPRQHGVQVLQSTLSKAMAESQPTAVAMGDALADPLAVYLTRGDNGEWLRAVVLRQHESEAQVVISLIDYGATKLISIDELFIVGKLFSVISNFPAQVLRVRLEGVPTPLSASAARLLRQRVCGRSVALRVVPAPQPPPGGRPPPSPPLVHMFVRAAATDLRLRSVNDDLIMSCDL